MSGYQDSNLGPPAPKAGALTGLRYTPKIICKAQNCCLDVISELRVQRYCFFLNLANFMTFFFCFSSFILISQYKPVRYTLLYINGKEMRQFRLHAFMMPCSTKMPLRISTDLSTCSFVCVAMSAYLTKVSCGAHAGGTTGLMNTPLS